MSGEFEQALILTTPTITGKKVRDAQWLLAGHNIFADDKPASLNIATLTGRIDGIYGPVTAGATKDAKYLLGYPEGQINTAFGQVLYEYLTGKANLPDTYKAERKKRLQTPTKIKALEYAESQIGYKEHEPPYNFSNGTKFGHWYGMNGVAWCDIFVSYCINDALGTLVHPAWKYSFVPTTYADAREGRHYMSITFAPEPGDLVTYNWDGPNCHIEFYEKDLGHGTFSAIGGNTMSNLPSSNGGQVSRSTRYQTQVSHFIRLNLPQVG